MTDKETIRSLREQLAVKAIQLEETHLRELELRNKLIEIKARLEQLAVLIREGLQS